MRKVVNENTVQGRSNQLALLGAVHHLLQPPPHRVQLLHQLLHLLPQAYQQKKEEEVFYHRTSINKGMKFVCEGYPFPFHNTLLKGLALAQNTKPMA